MAKSALASWSYSTARNRNLSSSYIFNLIRYTDTRASTPLEFGIYMVYHSSQSTFRRPWVINSSIRNHEEYGTSKIEKSILFLVNDICSTVPFLVGLRTFALIVYGVQTKRLPFRIPCFHYQRVVLINISIRDGGEVCCGGIR